MRNYAGHRLAPWLAHVMVSRQETARQLLTPGEVMQLPPDDELVLVAGLSPIRGASSNLIVLSLIFGPVAPGATLMSVCLMAGPASTNFVVDGIAAAPPWVRSTTSPA